MNSFLKKEEQRKTHLFAAWKSHLYKVHAQLRELSNDQDIEFEEIYEDLVTVTHVSKNCANLELRSGEKNLNINLGPDICKSTRRLDCMFMALGYYRNKWWTLEILSAGSYKLESGEVHMSLNPDYLEDQLEVLQ